jgi:plasmid stabilization system protein ParE
MAFKIIWSRQAGDDLGEIVTFIAKNNRAKGPTIQWNFSVTGQNWDAKSG